MKPGVYTLDAAAYHADPLPRPSLSASIANVLLNQSPAHAREAHPALNPGFTRTYEEKFDVGIAAHALLLEGEAAVQMVAFDDWRTKAAKEERDAARAKGQIPLLAKHWEQVQAMVAATYEQLARVDVSPPLFLHGKPEQTLVWEDDGVLCRARLDWLRDDRAAIDDYKTTSASANPERWTRTLYGMGADVQAAFYLRGLEKICHESRTAGVPGRADPGKGTSGHTDSESAARTGAAGYLPQPTAPGLTEFRWCVQETYPPYALSVVSLAPDALALANDKVDNALALWRRCLETDSWPAYPAEVCYAESPPWAEAQWLAREAREAA